MLLILAAALGLLLGLWLGWWLMYQLARGHWPFGNFPPD